MCRIRKAAEPPTAAQQRVVGAEANRIAASNAAPPRYGQCNRQALQLFELPACNANFLWEGEREGYLFIKKEIPLPCTLSEKIHIASEQLEELRRLPNRVSARGVAALALLYDLPLLLLPAAALPIL